MDFSEIHSVIPSNRVSGAQNFVPIRYTAVPLTINPHENTDFMNFDLHSLSMDSSPHKIHIVYHSKVETH